MTGARKSVGSGLRADAQRNVERLIQSARALFETSGLDAPIRDIADHAGVGVGTLYRHFPRREDLIAAVFRNEMNDCADAAATLAAENGPYEALARWVQLFVALAVTKRGIANALRLDDPSFADLGAHREQRLRPAFRDLFQAAATAGEIRKDVDPDELFDAIASLCSRAYDSRPEYAHRMAAVFVEGLQHGSAAGGASRR